MSKGKIIQNGPIEYSCIDDVISIEIKPFGFSYIFQKNGVLFHAFTDFNENRILDTVANNVIVSSIAYKQFDFEKVDIIWYEKIDNKYELFYQWFRKTPPLPPELQIYVISRDVTCHGLCDGSIDLMIAGGTPPYSIILTDLFEEYGFDSLCSGMYKLIVRDANGYSKNATILISEPDSLYITKTVKNVTCNDGSDGSITIDVHGGILPYDFSWSTGETTEDLVNIPSGKYWISVSDANGCSITDTTIVHELLPIQVLFNDLYGSCEGEIIIDSLTVSGGTPPYYIKIDDNLFLNEIHQDGASHAFGILGYPLSGWHTIVIKDANECESEEFSVLVPYQIKIEFDVRPLTCFNGSDANINSIISGGTNPYEYIWNTGETSDYLTDIDSGTYILKITDFKGCIGIDSVEINNPAPVITGDIIGNTMVQQSSIESYSVSETSGSNYNWVIKSGDIVTGQGSNSIQVQWASPSTGKVSVIKTDENLCQGDTISINVEISTGYFSPSIDNIRVFPNPFSNKAIIQFPNSQDYSYDLVIMDLTGKIVRVVDKIIGSSYELNKDGLPAGLYLIELRGPNIYRGKIIIE